jgi:alkylated DNA repair dioxygenase AlkB
MRGVSKVTNHTQAPPSMPLDEVNGRFAYLTPDSALCRDPSTVYNNCNIELENGQVSDQHSYLTQSALPLDISCRERGRADHTEQSCSANVSVLKTPGRTGQIEAWLRAGDPASQTKSTCYDHVKPVPSLYAASEATTECEGLIGTPAGEQLYVPDNTHLRDLTEQLIAQQKKGLKKPEPQGQPEVWADGRQELCETLHYYRAYQSACYSTGGFARGFMFDKVAHHRDYMDSTVVISRAGGGLLRDVESGEMKSKKDQSEDSTALGLRNCMIHFNPVVIITGVDNPNIPSKPPHQYCVLDYFKPTHVWVEKSGDSKIVRYRFEKLNTKKESWWRAKDTQEVVELGSLSPPVKKTCGSCNLQSQQVYLNGWMCLQPACATFWKIPMPTPGPGNSTSAQEPKETALVYDPRFLKQKTPWQNDDHDYPLISNAAELSGHSIPGENTSVAFWSGMVCPNCGRCTSRLNWTNWECSNAACKYTRTPPHTLVSALSIRDPLWPVTSSYTLSRDTLSSLIELKVSFENGYRINRYDMPGVDGFITHMIANKTVLEEEGGPDAMFEELQQADIGLQRWSMPNGQLKGPNYCRHFAVNYGMPYKFIAATASRPFDGAARPITSTRSRLNWAAKLLLIQETGKSMEEVSQEWQEKEFNEVLALGYFEEQRINYHDDGEFGLGPTIATLSLGAPGTMRIRMKARHYHGVSSVAGLYDDAAPIPGCQHYDARLALQPSLEALKKSDSKAYNARRKQIPKQLGLNNRGTARDALTMQLGHGDIVIMHGADVQKYYEHAVEHSGKLRFALTCRYIDPKSLKPEDQPGYEVGPDMERYDGSGLT